MSESVTAVAKDETRKDGFQKFWTKDKTEALLALLEEQATKGQINHEIIATDLTAKLQLSNKLRPEMIVDRVAILISNYKREIEREERTGHLSTWRWRNPLKRLVEKLQKPGENDETDTESETEDETSKIDKLNLVHGERRGRMPDHHVEVLLDCYKFVLQNRMLSSGRLGKGSFQEVTDEMNKRCKTTETNSYEREQLAAKLQNLKTQFRNRKSAVEEGKESKTNWKWYNMMEDLAQAETGLRESFDGNKPVSSPMLSIEEEVDRVMNHKRAAANDKYLPEKRSKRHFNNGEIESSLGDLAVLLTHQRKNEPKADKLKNIQSMAFQLFTGITALIDYVDRPIIAEKKDADEATSTNS